MKSFFSSPTVQKYVLVFLGAGLGGLAAVPELSAFAVYLTAAAGLLTGKALLSKPGEAPRVPPAS